MTDEVTATSAVYDVIAGSYDVQTRVPSEEFLAHQVAFAELVSGTVADLGCGTGRDLTRFGHLDVFGVDRSAGMLELARTRGPVVQGDLRRPPVRDGALGGIWSSAALLHVPREDVPAALRAWCLLLRPGGVLGLSTSLGSGEGWEVVPYDSGGRERWFVHHEEGVLLDLLRTAGFAVQTTSRRTTHRNWLMVIATASG